MVFQRQVGAFDSLRGELSDYAVDVLQAIVGDCSQALTHRGPVTINGTLTINYCDGDALSVPCGEIDWNTAVDATTSTPLWAKAVALWTEEGGGLAYVDCVESNRTGSTEGDGIRVYLLRGAGNTPNVRAGDVILYQFDAAGNAVCISDVGDDPIGTVKSWTYAPNDLSNPIRGGWQEVTDLRGRTPAGYVQDDPYFGVLGGVAGTITEAAHPESPTSASSSMTSSESAEPITVSSGGPSVAYSAGNTNNYTVDGTISSETVTFSCSDVATEEEATGITITAHSAHQHRIDTSSKFAVQSSPTSGGVNTQEQQDYSSTGNESTTLDHVVTDNEHDHQISGDDLELAISITGATHSHTFDSDPHNHLMLVATVSAAHTHTAGDDGHQHLWDHTHDAGPFSHASGDNQMPYLVKTWIERYE